MEKLQEIEAPPVILAIENKTEAAVAAWYKKPHPKKLMKTQTQEEELQFIPPAPPVIMGEDKK